MHSRAWLSRVRIDTELGNRSTGVGQSSLSLREDYTDPPEGGQRGETGVLKGHAQEDLTHNIHKHEL